MGPAIWCFETLVGKITDIKGVKEAEQLPDAK